MSKHTKPLYTTPLAGTVEGVASLRQNHITPAPRLSGRILLRGGRVVDPANGIDSVMDIALLGDEVLETGPSLTPQHGDTVVECGGLLVLPGLIDLHLHLYDLFEVTTRSAECAAQDGVTTAFSPGAGNTFMAPALLGAEMDRGLPLNAGLFLGGGAMLACSLENDELVALFRGELAGEAAAQRLSRNAITNQTAPFILGVKEHMGHAIMPDEALERLYDVTSRAGLLFMSHTQEAEHAERLARLSAGRPLHLGHTNAAGCGPAGHEALQRVLALCRQEHITGEFVTTMLRAGGGSREGLKMDEKARLLALETLREGCIDILVSDGQNQATMKGFGDTRDNIPALLELWQEGVLSLPAAVATMTQNPARLLAQRTGNPWWRQKMGNLSPGSAANVTVVDPAAKRAAYTLVNGAFAAFESRLVRTGYGAGRWLCARGPVPRMGVGDISMFHIRH